MKKRSIKYSCIALGILTLFFIFSFLNTTREGVENRGRGRGPGPGRGKKLPPKGSRKAQLESDLMNQRQNTTNAKMNWQKAQDEQNSAESAYQNYEGDQATADNLVSIYEAAIQKTNEEQKKYEAEYAKEQQLLLQEDRFKNRPIPTRAPPSYSQR